MATVVAVAPTTAAAEMWVSRAVAAHPYDNPASYAEGVGWAVAPAWV